MGAPFLDQTDRCGSEELFSLFPAQARVCDGDAVAQEVEIVVEGLFSGKEVAFQHETCDCGIDHCLIDDGAKGEGLFCVVFSAVAVGAIDDEARFEAMFFEGIECKSDGMGVVIGSLIGAAEDEMGVGISGSLDLSDGAS